ncbi:phosphorothioated DNA-binding restriction endonuclease [Actinomadura hibisca]|uniref:phosphorothioated DNA-binding restriction endonuclease n=1 Tax=Actinomadura hibisca TaxID=68565 RepID=UPI00082AE19E|nr:HNH endonuclease [Actinomadura hibisca]
MDWVQRVVGVNQYTRAGERAPHKPLLILHALGRFQRQGAAPLPFSEVERGLGVLLREFGPPRKTSPAYPFHHLTSDDRIWVVETPEGEGSPGTSLRDLRAPGVRGRLHPDFAEALGGDPQLLPQIVQAVLDANFPSSMHADILEETGLDMGRVTVVRTLRPRDPEFRARVLDAYDHRCAFCGYNGWLGGASVGVDSAHLRWHAHGGPDDLGNGLCLCALHHRLLDRGVLGLTGERTIAVSGGFSGAGAATATFVHELSGRPVAEPRSGGRAVEETHIDWHTRQVFRRPAA